MSVVPEEDDSVEIREVWSNNLVEEVARISRVIDHFPYVAMDTEFPGTVYNTVNIDPDPIRRELNSYKSVMTNVNLLDMIQLGLALSDEQGNLPACGTNNRQCVWQFNFSEFDLKKELFNSDSIELLRKSGIDFARNSEFGIQSQIFAELIMGSGVVLNDDIQWVTFHCSYDFGYLLKILTGKNLPEKRSEFFLLVKTYFPRVYDIKYMLNFCNGLHGGLSRVAEVLHVKRVGISHQAGSDSLLTSRIFTKLKQTHFPGPIDQYCGFLYTLGNFHKPHLLAEANYYE